VLCDFLTCIGIVRIPVVEMRSTVALFFDEFQGVQDSFLLLLFRIPVVAKKLTYLDLTDRRTTLLLYSEIPHELWELTQLIISVVCSLWKTNRNCTEYHEHDF
jgi:hypothetical protein